jgi:hypothetical protein
MKQTHKKRPAAVEVRNLDGGSKEIKVELWLN